MKFSLKIFLYLKANVSWNIASKKIQFELHLSCLSSPPGPYWFSLLLTQIVNNDLVIFLKVITRLPY